MASIPGILTEWPWKPLGNLKYLILAPWVIHSTLLFIVNDGKDRDSTYLLMFPLMLWRMIHNQIWITLSRYRTAKGNGRIVDKGLEFDQVDREKNWDDQILFNGGLSYLVNRMFSGAQNMPLWRTDGVIFTFLLHAGLVEYFYYWFHRALHHHYLYSRYHSRHHSSIVTEPITSVIHPFAEHVVYSMIFSMPILATVFIGTVSCLMYTPTFHSLHHTQFRTNYSLFMPIYDYIYGTMDKSTDALYESSMKRGEELPDVVHLTHLTTPESIYHLPLGFASLASRPHKSTWYMWLMWPVTFLSMILTRIYGRPFVVERQFFNKLTLQTWVIPRYTTQYYLQLQNGSINTLIEEAIVEAEKKGVKVTSVGLLDQGEELNGYGGLYVRRHPHLKLKVVDGSSLAVAVILNSIPRGTTQVVLRGNLTKVAYAIAFALSQKGIQVTTLHQVEYLKLTKSLNATESCLVLGESCGPKMMQDDYILEDYYILVYMLTETFPIWLVGYGFTDKEQMNASKGTLFVPFSQLPTKKLRKDCFYHYTPALKIPTSMENVHSFENWLPRRLMSAWRVAGIVHALEDYHEHDCGYPMSSNDKIWLASLRHGFQPLLVNVGE
ncbi:very-long-chain aldehyde decarbonylase CER1-like [Malus sylvestris]|uniref:very-long-chain aldehyde decarbonylase CER1-like n=1 Tax=Malus sylvestris TaxID=3752 RepID=UPI0021AC29FF|nr:very-long-chain aldehyde decarbonylase CER1-like [Malus sylvestris]